MVLQHLPNKTPIKMIEIFNQELSNQKLLDKLIFKDLLFQ